jgi:hypothetical protein
MLSFRMAKSAREPEWFFADRILPVPKSDKAYKSELPLEAVQFWLGSHYPPPPFRIDKDFRVALSLAVKEYGSMPDGDIPQEVAELIFKRWTG